MHLEITEMVHHNIPFNLINIKNKSKGEKGQLIKIDTNKLMEI